MSYTFTPPVVTVWYPIEGALKYPLRHGVTVLVTGTTVTQKRYPRARDVRDADYAFVGGYVHVIEQEVADILADAGLAPYIDGYVVVEPPPEVGPPTYDEVDETYDDGDLVYDGDSGNPPPPPPGPGTYNATGEAYDEGDLTYDGS